VRTYLDDRRLLGSEVILESATYTWVSVVAVVRARPRANKARVSTRSAEAIYRYIHPTSGGPDYAGWPFGREHFAGEVYSILQAVEGIDFVEQVDLHLVDPSAAKPVPGEKLNRIAPANGGLLCSYQHRVTVE
jgi:hypothetical protein